MNTDKVSEMLNNRKLSEKAAYSDEGVALFESTDRMTTVRNVNIDALLLSLCQSGHATLTIDGVEHEVSTYDLLVCLPGMTISRSETSGDICGCCICMSKDYVQQLSQMNSGDLWNAILFLSKNPVLRLEPSEAQSFKMYYDIIKAKINRQDRRYGKKLVETLFQACLYDFYGLLERFLDPQQRPRHSAEKVFRDFIGLLSSTYPRPRSVAFYADKLCITPKYLSAVCKQVSGMTALKLISNFVSNDILRLLNDTDKSMKEICNELGFPNPTFFGTYVRKTLGMSPRQYRERRK